MEQKKDTKPSEKEEKLLNLIRELGFGQIVIYVADGQPVRAEEIRKSIKFSVNTSIRLNNSRSYDSSTTGGCMSLHSFFDQANRKGKTAMKRTKKTLAMLLALVMTLSILVGIWLVPGVCRRMQNGMIMLENKDKTYN